MTNPTCEAPFTPDAASRLQPGDCITTPEAVRYRIEHLLAEGGMGTLYVVRDLTCDRLLVLKILRDQDQPSEATLQQFKHEATITSQLEHPNIVPVHELNSDSEGRLFYVMKHVDGILLASILSKLKKQEPEYTADYSLTALLNIFLRICDAIAFAHARGVVHMDLKPQNIMIGDFGEVLVLDWGLAQKLASHSAPSPHTEGIQPVPLAPDADSADKHCTRMLTLPNDEPGNQSTDQILGSPGYIAPELLTPGQQPITTQADIYSLGVILYNMLALRQPYEAGSTKHLIKTILAGDPPPPVAFNNPMPIELPDEHITTSQEASHAQNFPHCPNGFIPAMLSGIAMKCMQRNPTQRYQDVPDLQKDIESFLSGVTWQIEFDEDFGDESWEKDWHLFGGEHEWEPHDLCMRSGQPHSIILNQPVSGDLCVEFECRIEGTYLNEITCFLGARRDVEDSIIAMSGYQIKYGAHENTQNLVTRCNQVIWSEPASPLAAGETYRFRVEWIGSRLRLLVNHEEVFNITDGEPLSGSDRCVLGLQGWVAEIHLSHIGVFTLGRPWNRSVIDIAESLVKKGRYSPAIELFSEILESPLNPAQHQQVTNGLEQARRCQEIESNLPMWQDTLKRIWPDKHFQLRIENNGLALSIANCDIQDLSPLMGMPLKALYCEGNGIQSIKPLQGMPLTLLSCWNNDISDLAPLQGMPLTALYIDANPISDLSPLQGMPLQSLNCSQACISDLAPLQGMPITSLHCGGNQITDLSPLSNMPLSSFSCQCNNIADLAPLESMPLIMLNCSGNRIESLLPLRNLPLTTLHCGFNRIENLDPLKDLPLTVLTCQGNRIRNLLPIRHKALRALVCSLNPIKNLTVFASNPPSDFLFDCPEAPVSELAQLSEQWRRDFRTARHARHADILLALHQGDTQQLKSFAKAFKNHRYLFIPKFLPWNEAKRFCEELGGHLATIENQQENDFILSLFPQGSWFWLGLYTTAEEHTWVTGQAAGFTAFGDAVHRKTEGPKIYFSGTWVNELIPNAANPFMIQWDDC